MGFLDNLRAKFGHRDKAEADRRPEERTGGAYGEQNRGGEEKAEGGAEKWKGPDEGPSGGGGGGS